MLLLYEMCSLWSRAGNTLRCFFAKERSGAIKYLYLRAEIQPALVPGRAFKKHCVFTSVLMPWVCGVLAFSSSFILINWHFRSLLYHQASWFYLAH